MKKVLPFFSIALIMAACSNSPKASTEPATTVQQYTPDTVGLASFQQWKAQNELAAMNEYNNESVAYSAAPAPRKSAPVYRAPKKASVASRPRSNSGSTASGASGTRSSESSNVAKAPAKKGWSKAAKGAVIGGAAGAIGGAVIHKKNPVVGAVIGGVVGAGTGYGIGRGMDKRDGRYLIMHE